MRKAFTLAEVLITLAIIGVVAAMTIPTLVANYQKKAIPIRIKKVYAELTQVIQLSQAENGPMVSWNLAPSYEDGNRANLKNTKEVLSKYILPYYKGISECSTGHDYTCGMPSSSQGVNYRLNNGVGISFLVAPYASKIYCTVSVKFNNENLISGKDWFYFEITNGRVLPYGWYDGISREDILEGFVYTDPFSGNKWLQLCAENDLDELPEGFIGQDSRYGCTALLMLDNWQIKEDYPW